MYASITTKPPGSWTVVGTGASGSVGDTVTIEFAITFVTDSYADTDFYIKTVDEARQKLSFVGVISPAGNPIVTAEKIDWPGTEFEAGVTQKYRIQVRIDRGVVGDEIGGFYFSTYTVKSGIYGVADDIKVNVIAKKVVAKKTVSKQKTATSSGLASISDLNSMFRSVHGRNPTMSEWRYWADRLLDKSDREALKGAMQYHKARGRTTGEKVRGIESTSIDVSEINSIFRGVFGHNPSQTEWHYWASRLHDRMDRFALEAAMTFHKINNIYH